MRWLIITAVLFAFGCGTTQERVQIKTAWYQVVDAYEQRLVKCFEGEAYKANLPGCEVDSAEKKRVLPVMIAYKESSRAFADNPEFASCTMARAIIDISALVSDKLGESFVPPVVEAFCTPSVSELDLLFAEDQANKEGL